MNPCAGPMVWFDIDDGELGAVLECSCGYIIVTGNFNNQEHAFTPIIRSVL